MKWPWKPMPSLITTVGHHWLTIHYLCKVWFQEISIPSPRMVTGNSKGGGGEVSIQGSYSFGVLKFHDDFPWLFKVFHDLNFTIRFYSPYKFSKNSLKVGLIACLDYLFCTINIIHFHDSPWPNFLGESMNLPKIAGGRGRGRIQTKKKHPSGRYGYVLELQINAV